MEAAPHPMSTPGRSGSTARYRVRPGVAIVAARAATALVGGYAAAAGIATLIARLLPVDRAEATGWGMMLSFLVYATVALWCFHEQRIARVVLFVWGGAAALAPLAWLLGVRP